MEDRVIVCLSISVGVIDILDSDTSIIEAPEEVLLDELSCHNVCARLNVTGLRCADVDPRVLSRVLEVEGELISSNLSCIKQFLNIEGSSSVLAILLYMEWIISGQTKNAINRFIDTCL